MEIITGVGRRRRWQCEERLRIAADAPPSDRLALSPPCPAPGKAAPVEAERIEIALPDGTCIRVGADVGLAALRRVMTAVRR